ncbi:MAG: TonB-dependent receptor [Cyanothece sp. SIO2G6]|nr:TonB-dependent receptor [Cyanothece sp. SIO2G6]
MTETETPTIRINVTGELLDQPIFTPFRREGTVREASQPVYVINRQQIEAQGARTVDEALRYLPGILSEGTAGGRLGALSGQFIRGGVSAQTLILLDGRPLNDGAFGGVDLSNFTTDAVEQIEVLPGGGSVLYGSNAIGGVINIITRRSIEDGVEVSAGVTGGSFGFNDQVLQVRGATDTTRWVIGYNRTAADNDFPFRLTSTDFDSTRANAEVLYNNVNFNITSNINDRNEVRFGLLYLSKDLAVPGGVPVPDSISGGFNALTRDDRQETENMLLDLAYESQLSQSQDSVLTARVYLDFLDSTFDDPVADNEFESPSERRTDQMAVGGQLQHAWQFASNQNITYGLDYRHVEADNSTLDLTTGDRTVNYDDSINQWGLFSRYQVDILPRLSANLGVRQDFNDLVDGSFTSASVGIQANLTDTTTFRTNFARNFRVPSLSDLFFEPFNNPDLDPESALSFDVGVDQELGDRGLLRFTFYRNDIRNAISFNLETSTPQNIGRVRAIGIEAEATYQVFDDIFAFGNYTWNRPIIKDGPTPDNNGNLLPFTHADSWNVGLSYENQQELYAALFLHTVRDFFVDRGNTESLNGRTTLDFKLRVPVNDVVALNASVNNIFDAQYEEFPGFPGLGRNFQVGLRSTF